MSTTGTQDRPPAPGRGLAVRLTAGGYFLAMLALLLSALTLPGAVPGRPAGAYLGAAAALAAALLGSLILHELGHAGSARRHGADVGVVSIGLFGGTTHGGYDLPGPRAQRRVAAAGPLVSLILAITAAAAAMGVAALGADELVVLVLAIAALGNAVLGVLSLLPGAGPDGGRIVRALTWARTGDPAKAGLVAARAGQVTGFVLAAAGIGVTAVGYPAGLWLAVIGLLAFVTSRSQARQLLTAASLTGLRVADVVRLGAPDGVPDWQTVHDFLAGQPAGPAPAQSGQAGSGQAGSGQAGAATAFPLRDFGGRPAGLLTLSQLAMVPEDHRDAARLRDVATPLVHVVTTSADEPLASLLGRLAVWPRVPAAVHTAGYALVLNPDGGLAGLITPADMSRATQRSSLRRRTGHHADQRTDRYASPGTGTRPGRQASLHTGEYHTAAGPPRL